MKAPGTVFFNFLKIETQILRLYFFLSELWTLMSFKEFDV